MTGEEEFRAVAAAHPEATDIHAEEGGLCFVRERGRLIRETAGDLLPWLLSRLPPERREELAERGACDGSFSLGSTRCRLHVYRAAGKISAAVRRSSISGKRGGTRLPFLPACGRRCGKTRM